MFLLQDSSSGMAGDGRCRLVPARRVLEGLAILIPSVSELASAVWDETRLLAWAAGSGFGGPAKPVAYECLGLVTRVYPRREIRM